MTSRASRRADIQALRGIAVLLVVAWHAFPAAVPFGFIGVDVFFVVSGWLITGLIVTAQEEGRFSALHFWANRAKRLLPAAYATIALTLLGAWLVLAGRPLERLGGDVAGALTFTLNFRLADTANYFAPSSEMLPLLHLWSLAVEEQFYLVLPLLLLFAPARWRWLVPVLLAAGSLMVLAQPWRFVSPAESFFLPWTRGWQLAIGGIGWFAARRIAGPRRGGGWAGAALVALLLALALGAAGPVVAGTVFHPGLAACFASILALGLLWLRAGPVWEAAWLAPLRWTGDISYALYLVHWPLLALWRAAQYSEGLAAPVAAGLVVAGFALAALLHYTVERPLHRKPLSRPWRVLALSVLAAVPLALAGWALARGAGDHLPDGRSFLDHGCGTGGRFTPRPSCMTGERPDTLLLGDSLAAHLVPGLEGVALLQATRAACAPVAGLKQRYSGWETDRTARECLTWMDSAVDQAVRSGTIRTAILAGGWSAGWRARDMDYALLRLDAGGRVERLGWDEDLLVSRIAATVARLRAAGIRVVMVAPPPPPLFDAGMCHAAQSSGKWMPLRFRCGTRLAEQADQRAALARILGRIEREADVAVFRFESWLCRAGTCAGQWRGQPLFHDQGHFSAPGFAPLAREIGLAGRLQALAR